MKQEDLPDIPGLRHAGGVERPHMHSQLFAKKVLTTYQATFRLLGREGSRQ